MDSKVTGIVAYIGWIGWLISFLAGTKDEFSNFHLNQALIVAIIGIIPLGVTQIIALILAIIGIINAVNGQMTELPVVGTIRLLK